MSKKTALVGYTGFVGSNLCRSASFDFLANSKNVQQLYGVRPDVLIYAGVTGTKWYANTHKEYDEAIIRAAEENIVKIAPKKLVLISTVDVYSSIDDVTEETPIEVAKLHTYGKNRYMLEKWTEENIEDYHIVRLPAIYGENLKKNFIYDLIHLVPYTLTKDRMDAIITNYSDISSYYRLNVDKNFELIPLEKGEYRKLREIFAEIPMNALSFTNSESSYQFLNLATVWKYIETVIKEQIRTINLVTEPIAAEEVFEYIYHDKFRNDTVNRINYNLKSIYADSIVGHGKQYYGDKDAVLYDLEKFVRQEIEKL